MPIPSSLQQGLRLPVVAAPMFLTSGPALVSACSRAGFIGSFPALAERLIARYGGANTSLAQVDARFL